MENDKIDTELIQQVAQTKEWSKGAERRIQKLENDNETFKELTVLVRLQKESMDMQKESMDIMNQTLLKVSESNNNISNEIQGIKEDVATLNTKVERIESADKVSIRQFIRKYSGVFLVAFVGGLAGFVLVKFGLK